MCIARCNAIVAIAVGCLCLAQGEDATDRENDVRRIDGYRGIWFDLGQRSEFGSKYSGGLGTYTAKHHPLAIYVADVDRTFFVYGGTTERDEDHLLAMVSYYDHASGAVPKPVVVHDKEGVNDPHDNPSIQIDDTGRIWVFVSGRGQRRPGYVYRSRIPYDIASFERLAEDEFTYPQPWWREDRGGLLLFTKYTNGRELYWRTSDATGGSWSEDRKLAGMGGHYQVSNERGGRVVTAFNRHPGGTVDLRTDLYFAQTSDGGATWRTASGLILDTPLVDPNSPALVRGYEAEGRLVYLKDIGFDAAGHPVILYITSGYHEPGPGSDPRIWTIAHWKGDAWVFHEVTRSTHNYDMGSLYIEPDGRWRIIGPTEAGPQLHGTGGEIAIWLSDNQGRSWERSRVITSDSPRNHGYARRPVDAHPEFYAFWADGDPDAMSESRLYFSDQDGARVWELPYAMEEKMTKPTLVSPRR